MWQTEASPTKISEKVSDKEGDKTKIKVDKRKIKNSDDMAPSTTTGEIGGQNVNECKSHGSKGSTANCATDSNCKSSAF